jgi:hypothetical protein
MLLEEWPVTAICKAPFALSDCQIVVIVPCRANIEKISPFTRPDRFCKQIALLVITVKFSHVDSVGLRQN